MTCANLRKKTRKFPSKCVLSFEQKYNAFFTDERDGSQERMLIQEASFSCTENDELYDNETTYEYREFALRKRTSAAIETSICSDLDCG